jgi:hypothetical protein
MARDLWDLSLRGVEELKGQDPERLPSRLGRPRADDRRTVNGILFVLRTGCRWHDLPREYGT